MSIFNSLAQHPALSVLGLNAVGAVLLHFLWQGAVIGLAAFLALRAMRGQSANVRYWTGVAFLLLMAAAPVGMLMSAWESASPPLGVIANAATPRPSPTPERGLPKEAVALQTSALEISNSASFSASSMLASWKALVAVAWLCGVSWMACRFVAAQLQAIRLRWVGVAPVPREIEQLARRLSGRLRVLGSWSVHVSSRVASPLVVGCLRPMILLPASALTELAPSQLEAVLLHELAHLRRFDLWINHLQALIETLLFFHPAVWWLSRQITKEREHCCDDLAVSALGDRALYANTLLALAEMPRPRAALAMSGQGKKLSARIARLYDEQPKARLGSLPPIGALIVALGIVLVLVTLAPRGVVRELRGQDTLRVFPPELPEVPRASQATATRSVGLGEIRVSVRNKDGSASFKPEYQLWYASKPTSDGPRPTSEWIDATGTAWSTLQSSQSKIGEGEVKLEPPREGRFRVSVFSRKGSLGRTRLSAPFDWKPGTEDQRIDLIMPDYYPLEARFIDRRTRKPIEGLSIRLFDEKGDIVHPANAGNVNFVTNTKGGIAAALPLGKFQIEVRGRKTWRYAPEVVDYDALDQRVAYESTIVRGDDMLIELDSTPLLEAEIDKRWPWIVQGKVTDEKGAPLEGVNINVATGMGTLLGGTQTRTAKDGSYLARFSQGIHTSDEIQMQYAVVSAHSNWRYEAQLNQQGAKFMARKEPNRDALEGFGAKLEDVFVPGKPLTIDFVLKPAEIVSGEVVDETGKPLVGYRVYLVTDPLPPASSVFEQGKTWAAGSFSFLAVPADRPFRLVVAPPPEGEANWECSSDLIRLGELKGPAGEDHTYRLTVPSSGAGKKKLKVNFTGFVQRLRC